MFCEGKKETDILTYLKSEKNIYDYIEKWFQKQTAKFKYYEKLKKKKPYIFTHERGCNKTSASILKNGFKIKHQRIIIIKNCKKKRKRKTDIFTCLSRNKKISVIVLKMVLKPNI